VDATTRQQVAQDIVVTHDSTTLPSGCSPREAAQLVVRFLDALNRGDPSQLAGFVFRSPVSGSGQSQWFSVSEDGVRPFAAYDLNSFLAYASERQQRHERLQLLAISVTGPSWHGGVDIVYTLTRYTSDRRPALPWLTRGGQDRAAAGKGAIDCANQAVQVWSMTVTGERRRANEPDACPKPPPDTPSGAVIACAGRGL